MQNRPRLCACFILIIYSLIKCEDKKPTKSLWLCPAYGNNRGVTTRHTSMVSLMSLCLSFFYFSVCIRELFAQLSTLTTVWSKPVCLVCPRAKVQARCAGQGEGERQRMAQGWGVAEKKTKWRLCESTRTDWQVKAARQDREPWCMTRNLEQQEAATNTTSCSRQLKIKTAASTLRRHETAFWRASPFPVTATRQRRYKSIVISCHRHEPLSVCTSFFSSFLFVLWIIPPTNVCAVNKHQVCIWQFGYKGFAQISSSSPGVIQLISIITTIYHPGIFLNQRGLLGFVLSFL